MKENDTEQGADLEVYEYDKTILAEGELGIHMRNINRYPLLKPGEEVELTSAIYRGKLDLLIELATTNPIFVAYLEEVVLNQVQVEESELEDCDVEDEDDVFDGAGRGVTFKSYFNSKRSGDGVGRDFEKVKVQVRELITLLNLLYQTRSIKRYNQLYRNIEKAIEDIEFSWTRLKKDRIYDAFESDNPAFINLQRNVEKMFSANLRLSMSIARRFFAHNNNHADMVQEANRGLLVAVERFDYRRGYKFSTYATHWIRQAVSRFTSQYWTIRVPVHLHDKMSAVRKMQSNHPEWDADQIASALKWSSEYVRHLQMVMKYTNVKSLDESLTNDHDKENSYKISEQIVDEGESIESAVVGLLTHEQMLKIMSQRLTPREYAIVVRRLGLVDDKEESLQDIGTFFNLSRERIRQLEQKAYQKLRAMPIFREMIKNISR